MLGASGDHRTIRPSGHADTTKRKRPCGRHGGGKGCRCGNPGCEDAAECSKGFHGAALGGNQGQHAHRPRPAMAGSRAEGKLGLRPVLDPPSEGCQSREAQGRLRHDWSGRPSSGREPQWFPGNQRPNHPVSGNSGGSVRWGGSPPRKETAVVGNVTPCFSRPPSTIQPCGGGCQSCPSVGDPSGGIPQYRQTVAYSAIPTCSGSVGAEWWRLQVG